MVELKISDLLLLQNTYWTQIEETSHCDIERKTPIILVTTARMESKFTLIQIYFKNREDKSIVPQIVFLMKIKS